MLSANKDRTSPSVGGRSLGQTWLVIIIYPRIMRCRVHPGQSRQGPNLRPAVGWGGSVTLAARPAEMAAQFIDEGGALLSPLFGPLARRGGAYEQSDPPPLDDIAVQPPAPHGQLSRAGAVRSTFNRLASARMSLWRQLGIPALAVFQLETVVMGSDSASATRFVPPSAVMM